MPNKPSSSVKSTLADIVSTLKTSIPKKDQSQTAQNFTVVKRNGSIVPFRKERIFRAIEAAFRDTKKIVKETALSKEVAAMVEKVTDSVVDQLIIEAAKGASLTVEGIQDIVEVCLMKTGHHDVARDYIVYRDQHKALREDSPENLRIERKDGSFSALQPNEDRLCDRGGLPPHKTSRRALYSRNRRCGQPAHAKSRGACRCARQG